ncbi:response regulator transcription factor [Bacillus alkalicellulosilyticus]|uniref:response regulator transcription factor n=1 Tax=Alkalihalobacterium alkalicellulosilyticum TaxID=1912214 RepID=UPI0009973302|nr:response regulator transcription factor [Bacillus alkalicellulosilyticus]
MNKVILVDDEVFVRKGLRSLIDWQALGCEVCGEADNGEDAFQLIQEYNPDIVITDVRMPVVDGLELIKKVRETTDLNTQFIIISGYNDFSYAQQAVRYKVFDFVLKPIDQEELEETLGKLGEKLKGEKEERDKKQKALFEQAFTQLLEGRIHDLVVEEWIKQSNISQSDYFYYVLVELNNILWKENDKSMKDLKDCIKDSIPFLIGEKKEVFLYEQQNNALGLLISSDHLMKVQGDIHVFADKIHHFISNRHLQATICVGSKIERVAEMKRTYDTANDIRNYKYILDENKPIIFEEVKEISVTYNELNNKLYSSLMDQIEENKVDIITEIIEEIFGEFKSKMFAPKAVKTSINRLVYGVIQTINGMDGNENNLPTLKTMIRWEEKNLDVKELKRVFTTFIVEAASYIQELRKDNMKGDIYKVKAYIENNYHLNISLKSIANKYFMNPVYMGQLFKKTFGMYFKDFLLNIRIDEAKRLLRQTDMRVYEVADKVGFGSTDYFVTQFEKINKMTPTEYRNHLLQKEKKKD